MRLTRRPKRAARSLALQAMLHENRALVAEQIANAILSSQQATNAPADPLQRIRYEQARIDAALARRIGKWG